MKLGLADTRPGYYNAAGERLPSVTTVAKMIQSSEGIIHWAWDCGMKGLDYRAERDRAADAGHLCHSMIEADIRAEEFTPAGDEETIRLAKSGYSAFLSWKEATRFSLLRSEVRLISERYQYGGRLDCIATVNGELCIVDWKTSGGRGVYESWLPQVAAYRQAWNENHRSGQIQACHLMILAKADAGFSHHYFPGPTMDLGWRAFLACLELYTLKKKLNKLL